MILILISNHFQNDFTQHCPADGQGGPPAGGQGGGPAGGQAGAPGGAPVPPAGGMLIPIPGSVQSRGFGREDCMKWTAGLLLITDVLAMAMAALIQWFLHSLLELLLPDYLKCGRRG